MDWPVKGRSCFSQEEAVISKDTENGFSRYLDLLRVRDYAKNLLIFAPVFFGRQATNTELLARAGGAFIAFSLIASSVYILNDYHDREEDRGHPRKKIRPLASGAISNQTAVMLGTGCFAAGFAAAFLCGRDVLALAALYVLLNISYTFRLKHIAVIDINVIALGFIIRIFTGSAATGILCSPWLIIVTFLLALFLALAKRRDDMIIYNEVGEKTRKVVDGYTLEMIDHAMMIMAAVLLVIYIVYSVSPGVHPRMRSDNLYITDFFVVLGVLRYLQLAFVEKKTGSPTDIFWEDGFIQLTILGWGVTFTYLVYI